MYSILCANTHHYVVDFKGDTMVKIKKIQFVKKKTPHYIKIKRILKSYLKDYIFKKVSTNSYYHKYLSPRVCFSNMQQ